MTPNLVKRILKAAFMGEKFVSPPAVYVGVFKSVGIDGLAPSEVDAPSYKRQPVNFALPDGLLAISNSAPVVFPVATGLWGDVSHFGIFDAERDGDLLAFGELESVKKIGKGDTLKFAPEEIIIEIVKKR